MGRLSPRSKRPPEPPEPPPTSTNGLFMATTVTTAGRPVVGESNALTSLKNWIRNHKQVATYLVVALVLADRKSTRLNSSHPSISYAVFCLKKKKKKETKKT